MIPQLESRLSLDTIVVRKLDTIQNRLEFLASERSERDTIKIKEWKSEIYVYIYL